MVRVVIKVGAQPSPLPGLMVLFEDGCSSSRASNSLPSSDGTDKKENHVPESSFSDCVNSC